MLVVLEVHGKALVLLLLDLNEFLLLVALLLEQLHFGVGVVELVLEDLEVVL